jgi:ribosomal-protein-alanine N-acetyltransferase
MYLTTDRLHLRQWRDDDLAAFAAINQDPAVMRWLGPIMTFAQTQAMLERIRTSWQTNGFGLFAVERRDASGCIGYIGLAVPRFEAPFTPCVEIGWRLASTHWGRGLATEGARAVLNWAVHTLALPNIVSFTVRDNLASRRVMAKIGLTYNPADDFDHPLLAADNPLRPHVLYRYPSSC